MHHFEFVGKNAALLPPLENFEIRQTMCDMLMYPQIEGLGLYVVYIVYHVVHVRIKIN